MNKVAGFVFLVAGLGCGMEYSAPVTRAACIPDGDYLIAIQESPMGHLDLPGGHIEEGDTSEHTAVKEVSEETGTEATILRYLGRDEDTDYYLCNFEGDATTQSPDATVLVLDPSEVSEQTWKRPHGIALWSTHYESQSN